ncbi:MAG: hypothetical protein FWC42_07660 [Proteobacteria bacterium]|nr:hypothetical protein [Pseudomonadota bacterium]
MPDISFNPDGLAVGSFEHQVALMQRAHSWKQAGNVSLWYYTENECNYPGWHLNADAAGCESLIALLDAFAADGVTASRTVAIKPPSKNQLRVPNNRYGLAAWQSPGKLRIVFSSNPTDWSFPLSSEAAIFTVGSNWLPSLREGISGIPYGRGDYAIGPAGKGNSRLWFWW